MRRSGNLPTHRAHRAPSIPIALLDPEPRAPRAAPQATGLLLANAQPPPPVQTTGTTQPLSVLGQDAAADAAGAPGGSVTLKAGAGTSAGSRGGDVTIDGAARHARSTHAPLA